MTTTPETIAELKRLLAEATPRNGTLLVAAVNALPSLLADIELLREALRSILMQPMANEWSREQARAALSVTEVK